MEANPVNAPGYYCKSERTKESVEELINKMANLKIFDSSQYNSCVPLSGFLEYIIQDHNYSNQSPTALPMGEADCGIPGNFPKENYSP